METHGAATFMEAVDLFLGLGKARGWSPLSLVAYKSELSRFEWYAEDQLGRVPLLLDLTPALVDGFVKARSIEEKTKRASGKGGRISARTLSRSFSVLRSFLREAQRYAKVNSAALVDRIPTVRLPDPLPRGHKQGELIKVLDEAKVLAMRRMKVAVIEHRAVAVVEFLYSTGARIAELCALTPNRLDVKRRMVRLLGKGNRERIVPFGRQALESMRRYWAVAGFEPKGEEACFRGRRDLPITGRTVERDAGRILSRLGPNAPHFPHSLRHSCGSDMLNAGANIRAIQEQLGHAKVTTTQIYTAVAKNTLVAAYGKAFSR